MITPSIQSTHVTPPGAYAKSSPAELQATTKTGEGKEDDKNASQLSEQDQQRVRDLKARAREVRAHEQAHLAAAGSYAKGGATYTYERGPDQRMYAVSGEVQVDTSAVANDPVATLRKAQVIRRAALAPTNPSSQDRQVAVEAAQMAQEAQAEIAAQNPDSSTELSRQEPGTTDSKSSESSVCPACGGAHSSAAHDGMSAYAATQTMPNETVRATA